MELTDVRRSTPAEDVIQPLIAVGACSDAITWINDTLMCRPKATAQTLWNTCPVGEWMEWLVVEVAYDEDCDDELIYDISEINGCGQQGYDYPMRNPATYLKAARAIRAKYESPWLP